MSDEEFQALLDRVIGGLPITLVIGRLALALRYQVDVGGEPAARALRAFASGLDEPEQEQDPWWNDGPAPRVPPGPHGPTGP